MDKSLQCARNVSGALERAGFADSEKIANTLQGQIWRCMGYERESEYIVKVTSKALHQQSKGKVDNAWYTVQENILHEKHIIEFLSTLENCPSSVIKFHTFFESNSDYYLSMEYGGSPIFKFILNAHKLIKNGQIEIAEWHRIVRKIFTQMVEATEFMHSNGVAHFDLSLENTLINDVTIRVSSVGDTERISFHGDVLIKIIDFGLAERFETNEDFTSNKYCGKCNYQSPEIVAQQGTFDAASNDIWCLGVTLFMMVAGCAPFDRPHDSDLSYQCIMNGQIKDLLSHWERAQYFDDDVLDLISSIFQSEDERATLQQIKQHRWLSK